MNFHEHVNTEHYTATAPGSAAMASFILLYFDQGNVVVHSRDRSSLADKTRVGALLENFFGIRGHFFLPGRNLFSRSELLTTETELMAIAPAAIIGLSRMPKNGKSRPAATGIPITL